VGQGMQRNTNRGEIKMNQDILQLIEICFENMENQRKQEWNDYYMSEEYADEILALLDMGEWDTTIGQA
jgi:Leu/Phe-tRNA-protein transferase